MPRVLVVSMGVPPQLNGMTNVMDTLSREFGPEEMILVGERPAKPVPYDRPKDLPPIRYLAKPVSWPKRGTRYFRWIRWFKFPFAVWKLKRIAREEKAGHILAVFPDEWYLAAAYLVAKLCRLPLTTYFHNTYLENRYGLSKLFARLFQPAVFRRSSTILVMSEGMRDFYAQKYRGTITEPLLHSFAGPLPEYTPPPPAHVPLRICLLGNINASNRDAMSRCASAIESIPDATLGIISGMPEWSLRKHGALTSNSQIISVPIGQEQQALLDFDILCLPHGFTGDTTPEEYATIFPTRTIQYLISGRPILAHAPEDCFLTRWLRRHDCAEIVVEKDAGAVRQAIERLRSDEPRRQQLVKNALLAAEQFQSARIANRLRTLLAESEEKFYRN